MARDQESFAANRDMRDAFDRPQISLLGEVDEAMVETLLDGLRNARDGEGDLVLEITTPGGDAELGRRMVLEVMRARDRLGRRFVFLGKTQVYSAGVTLMSAFPREDRYLTSDAVLLIHSRQLDKTIELTGPIRSSLPLVEAARQQIEIGIHMEEENFRRLIEGSDVSLDELHEKAIRNWYLTAEEAARRRLIRDIV